MIYVLFAAYNESEVMPSFLANIKQEMEKLGEPYTVIACTDASTDNTAEIIANHANTMPIHLIPQTQERGLGVAFRHCLETVCQLSQDENDIAIFMDADCTHDLAYSKVLIAKIREGNDIVIASRFQKESATSGFALHRQMLTMAASVVFRLLFPIKSIKDYTSGYRAYRLQFLQKLQQHYGGIPITERDFCCGPELLIKSRHIGAKFSEVPFDYRYELKIGESKMNIVPLVISTLRMCLILLRYR